MLTRLSQISPDIDQKEDEMNLRELANLFGLANNGKLKYILDCKTMVFVLMCNIHYTATLNALFYFTFLCSHPHNKLHIDTSTNS